MYCVLFITVSLNVTFISAPHEAASSYWFLCVTAIHRQALNMNW